MNCLAAACMAVCLVLLAPAATSADAPRWPTRIKGPVAAIVTKVRDGDTLEVLAFTWLDEAKAPAVRIDGIDTPEERGACAYEKKLADDATAAVQGMLTSPSVELFDIQNDKYAGRVRARVVTAAGVDIGQALIDKGLARKYRGGPRQPWCPVAAAPSTTRP